MSLFNYSLLFVVPFLVGNNYSKIIFIELTISIFVLFGIPRMVKFNLMHNPSQKIGITAHNHKNMSY
jgi:hypothetical protein